MNYTWYNSSDWSDIMSRRTKTKLRELFIYQVYTRVHTEEGTFKAFNEDLDRIKDLGVDVVYFLPIHPIGVYRKKGSLGCPYSIQDYNQINPEYGTMEDFTNTVEEIHNRGMKVMIDVVYNHTSHDSVLLKEHPEFFMRDEQGNLTSKEPDWSDIQDFDFSVGQPLYDELTDSLILWLNKGVDGFRFDVGSFLPIEFLEYAYKRMLEVNPEVILLSESVHGHYLRHMRNRGFNILSESEVYQVFDMAYDYDIHDFFEGYLLGHNSLNRYLEAYLQQEEIYPANYVKMRNLENHDFGRFAEYVKGDEDKIDNWTAFNFFAKGSAMVYAGQEFSDRHKPSLFDKECINRNGRDISPLIKTLSTIMKDPLLMDGVMDVHLQDKDVIVVSYSNNENTLVGLFNVGKETGNIQVEVPSGDYQNLLSSDLVTVQNNTTTLSNKPQIFRVS
jgi:glycosidase